jgi:hypothetical protein
VASFDRAQLLLQHDKRGALRATTPYCDHVEATPSGLPGRPGEQVGPGNLKLSSPAHDQSIARRISLNGKRPRRLVVDFERQPVGTGLDGIVGQGRVSTQWTGPRLSASRAHDVPWSAEA